MSKLLRHPTVVVPSDLHIADPRQSVACEVVVDKGEHEPQRFARTCCSRTRGRLE
jgi:hypothetical protein